MKRYLPTLLALCLLGPSLARGADPVEEYKRQILKPTGDLGNKDLPVAARREAADKLLALGSELPRIVQELHTALSDPDDAVQVKAAKALQQIGPTADEAGPDLVLALRSPNEDVRAEAASGLVAIYFPLASGGRTMAMTKDDAVEALVAALKDKSKKVRLRVAGSICVFGRAAKPAVPGLAEALTEKDEPGATPGPGSRVCIAAANSLARLGPDAKEAIPALLKVAKTTNDLELKQYAIGALGAIGDQEERVLPFLLGAVKDAKLRSAAVVALGGMGPARAKDVVPALLRALDVSDIRDKEYADLVQFGAINALAKLGPAAREAVPKIEQILNDPNAGFQARDAAESALKRLRP